MTPQIHRRFLSDPAFMTTGAALGLLRPASMVADSAISDLHESQLAEPQLYKRVRAAMRPEVSIEDSIAILPVSGVLARKPDVYELFYGVEDTAVLHEMFNELAASPQIRGILLDIDSPGGFMTGGPDFADAVRATNAKAKPVHAWTGGGMASLAYWIGSQAGMITAAMSAHVGSIGAYTTVMDYSKLFENAGVKVEVIKNKEATFKAAGITGTSLTDEQRAHLQERIQSGFDLFKGAVQSARPGVSADTMQGQVLVGKEAKAAGLVDAVGSREAAMKFLRREVKARS